MATPLTLVFETSTPRASLATIAPGGQMESREFISDRSHNAVLFSPLQELLDTTKFWPVGLVLVGSGPGSYSGTRVGIAAAQGVAIASGCPAVSVPSILAVPSAREGAHCLAIGDARRGSFWTAAIHRSRLVTEPALTDAAGLLEIISASLNESVSVFSFEDPDRFPLPAGVQDQIRHEFPTAADLWHTWCATAPATRTAWTAANPQPMYLKPPHVTPAKRSWLV